jgi:hypothetical protein
MIQGNSIFSIMILNRKGATAADNSNCEEDSFNFNHGGNNTGVASYNDNNTGNACNLMS